MYIPPSGGKPGHFGQCYMSCNYHLGQTSDVRCHGETDMSIMFSVNTCTQSEIFVPMRPFVCFRPLFTRSVIGKVQFDNRLPDHISDVLSDTVYFRLRLPEGNRRYLPREYSPKHMEGFSLERVSEETNRVRSCSPHIPP